jgi:hypothetical protein
VINRIGHIVPRKVRLLDGTMLHSQGLKWICVSVFAD